MNAIVGSMPESNATYSKTVQLQKSAAICIWKGCEIKGSSQEIAMMVIQWQKNLIMTISGKFVLPHPNFSSKLSLLLEVSNGYN